MSYQRSTAQQEKAVCAALLPPTTTTEIKKVLPGDMDSTAQQEKAVCAALLPHTATESDVGSIKAEGNAGGADVMKRLAFSNLTNCTFNFSFQQ